VLGQFLGVQVLHLLLVRFLIHHAHTIPRRCLNANTKCVRNCGATDRGNYLVRATTATSYGALSYSHVPGWTNIGIDIAPAE
jgi:hypothetical protein